MELRAADFQDRCGGTPSLQFTDLPAKRRHIGFSVVMGVKQTWRLAPARLCRAILQMVADLTYMRGTSMSRQFLLVAFLFPLALSVAGQTYNQFNDMSGSYSLTNIDSYLGMWHTRSFGYNENNGGNPGGNNNTVVLSNGFVATSSGSFNGLTGRPADSASSDNSSLSLASRITSASSSENSISSCIRSHTHRSTI